MNNLNDSNTSGNTLINDESCDCFNRLPCGVCRITNMMCPMIPTVRTIQYGTTTRELSQTDGYESFEKFHEAFIDDY